MRKLFIQPTLSLCTALLISFANPHCCVASPSELGVLGKLYDENLFNNEYGFVKNMASWKQYLYVSWQNSNSGEYFIHVWDLKNPTEPLLVESRLIGSLYDGIYIEPQDFYVRNGTLFYRSDDLLVSYLLGSNGSLVGDRSTIDFRDDRNTTLGSLFFAGSFAGIPRTMLTNNEYLNLPFEEANRRLEEYAIINIENQRTPFLLKTSRDVGLDLVSFDEQINATYKGFPASLTLNENNSTLSVRTFAADKAAGLRTFWTDKLRHFFKPSNFNKTFGTINNEVTEAIQLRAGFTNVIDQFRRDRNIPAVATISSLITTGYAGEVNLASALADFDIHPDDKLSLAFEKIISPLVSDTVSRSAATNLHQSILADWGNRVFQFLGRTELRRVMVDLTGEFNGEIADEGGVAVYVVTKILAPLVGNPEALRLRLSTVINRIVDNPVGDAVDGALRAFRIALPGSDLADSFITTPRCFRIPRSARGLLESALIESGPRLRENGKALFELLRLVRYYSSLSGHSRIEREIEATVRNFHSDLVNDLVRTFSGIATQIRGGSFLDRLNQYSTALNMRSILAESFSDAFSELLSQRAHGRIDADLSVREVLEARGLYIEDARRPVGAEVPTISSLLEVLRTLNLDDYRYSSLIQLAIPQGAARLETATIALLEQIERDYFGPISRTTRLNSASLAFIAQRLDPAIIGNFVSSLLNDTLIKMNDEIPLPSFVSRAIRINKGDCIAQWESALELASSASAVVGEIEISAGFLAAEEALISAYEQATQYILSTLLQRFLTEIISETVGDYSSWAAGLNDSETSVNLLQYTNGALPYRAFAFGTNDKIGVIMDGAIDPQTEIRTDSTLRLLVVSPTAVDRGTLLSLGNWDQVQTVVHDQGLIAIQGNKDDALSQDVMFVDYIKSPRSSSLISGEGAAGLYYLHELEHLNGGDLMALRPESGGIFLMKRP